MSEQGDQPTSTPAWLKKAGSATVPQRGKGLFETASVQVDPPHEAAHTGEGIANPEQLAAIEQILSAERNASQTSPVDVLAMLSKRPTWDTPEPTLETVEAPQPSSAQPGSAQPGGPASVAQPAPTRHGDSATIAPQPWVPPSSPGAAKSRKALSPREELRRERAKNNTNRRGFFRRPTMQIDAPAKTPAPIDPRVLPPPEVHRAGTMGPTERDQRKAQKAAKRAGISITQANAQSMVVDARSVGKVSVRTLPFIVPLIPAMLVAALATWAWVQGVVRVGGELPWVPIFIGILTGWMMRLGSRETDGGRIVSAVIITTLATLSGESTLQQGRPFTQQFVDAFTWSSHPALESPLLMIQQFQASMEKNLLIGFLLMLGPVLAGVVSSLDV